MKNLLFPFGACAYVRELSLYYPSACFLGFHDRMVHVGPTNILLILSVLSPSIPDTFKRMR